jgi:hypothetical protein
VGLINQTPTEEKSTPYRELFTQEKGGLDESSPYVRKIKSVHKKNQNRSVYLYILLGGLDESSPYKFCKEASRFLASVTSGMPGSAAFQRSKNLWCSFLLKYQIHYPYVALVISECKE